MNRKLFFASVLLLAAPAFVLAAGPNKYMLYSCGTKCVSEKLDASYQDLQKCTAQCAAHSDGDHLFTPKFLQYACNGNGGSPLPPDAVSICQGITSSRDPVEVMLNANNPNACPVGATSSAHGASCTCPDGMELDGLHTICLNPANIKENLRNIFAMLPDDTQQAIAAGLTGNDLLAAAKSASDFDLSAAANKLSDAFTRDPADAFAEYAYQNVFHDTVNFRKLIKRLGPGGMQALIKKMLGNMGVSLTPPPSPKNDNSFPNPIPPAPPAPTKVQSHSFPGHCSQDLPGCLKWANDQEEAQLREHCALLFTIGSPERPLGYPKCAYEEFGSCKSTYNISVDSEACGEQVMNRCQPIIDNFIKKNPDICK